MQPEPTETEKDIGKDLETFARLPAKTKELEALQEQAEKTIGEENAALHEKIRDKSE